MNPRLAHQYVNGGVFINLSWTFSSAWDGSWKLDGNGDGITVTAALGGYAINKTATNLLSLLLAIRILYQLLTVLICDGI